MNRELSRTIRRALIVTVAATGAVAMLAAAVTGSRTLLATGTVEVALACIASAFELLLAHPRDGRRLPYDPDRFAEPEYEPADSDAFTAERDDEEN